MQAKGTEVKLQVVQEQTNFSSHRSSRIHTASAQKTNDLVWAVIFLGANWEQ